MKRMSDDEVVKKYSRYVWQSPDRLRYEARLAHLDGREASARELNRRADVLAKHRAEKGETW